MMVSGASRTLPEGELTNRGENKKKCFTTFILTFVYPAGKQHTTKQQRGITSRVSFLTKPSPDSQTRMSETNRFDELNFNKGVISVLLNTIRGTSTYNFQTWAAFLLSGSFNVFGLWNMDISPERRGFLFMGYLLLTNSAFNLAKAIRDTDESDRLQGLKKKTTTAQQNQSPEVTTVTSQFYGMTWVSMVTSIIAITGGLYQMSLTFEQKSYFSMGTFFLLNSTVNLAKMVRDRHEADKWEQFVAAKKD